MNIEKILKALVALGAYIREGSDELNEAIVRTYHHNKWFTEDNTRLALKSIAENFLDGEKLWTWLENYQLDLQHHPKKIGLVMAGNIPLVGFHDFLCVLVTGNSALIKLSSKDELLLPLLTKKLTEIEPGFKDRIEFTERLKNFDAVIATGSSNSARYFEYYFGKYPHIIRKNRNSVALLTGKETDEEIARLGNDLFQYFGLGCRNVSKLYVSKGYSFERFLDALKPFETVMEHAGYMHNYDYNRTLLLMNLTPHFASDFLMVSENKTLCSPIASLYFEYYDSLENLKSEIVNLKSEIQCVVSRNGFPGSIPFGATQQPELWDYADGVDTVEFLRILD